MKRMTEPRSAAGVANTNHGEPTEYQRTSDRARKLGYSITETQIEGTPAFLVSRWGMSRMLASLAEVDAFLNRVAVGGACP
jgi:hypothetical protein